MLRLKGIPQTNGADAYLRRLFYSGKEAENKTEKCLLAEYGDKLQTQVKVETEKWVGQVDFITPQSVIEHKETGANKFRYMNSLPVREHLLQVLMYRELLSAEQDAVLYYVCRANQAEFRVWEYQQVISYEGYINEKYKTGTLDTRLEAERLSLEYWYDRDEIPNVVKHPFVIDGWCTSIYSKNAYQRCSWFDYCWSGTEYEGMKKIEIPKEYR